MATKFTEYFTPKKNIIHIRSMFHSRNQSPQESCEHYIRELYKLSEYADFNDRDDQIRDRLVVGIIDKELSTKLQLMPGLKLAEAIATVRQAEQVKNEMTKQSLEQVNAQLPAQDYVAADAVHQKSRGYYKASSSNYNSRGAVGGHRNQDVNSDSCRKCGYKHQFRSCPAYNATCHRCHRVGHFRNVFISRQPQGQFNNTPLERHSADELTSGNSQQFYFCEEGNVHSDSQVGNSNLEPWYVNLLISKRSVKFKIDTGADVTVMSENSYNELSSSSRPKLIPPDINLCSANSSMNVLGYCNLQVGYKAKFYDVKTYVAKCHNNLVSRSDAVKMSMLARVDVLGVVKGHLAHIEMNSEI